MKNNKKGFTLIELLAVIVILAVVMLIAVSAVGPLMAKSRKGSLSDEGLGAISAAQSAYQAEQMNATSAIKPTSTVCFDLKYLAVKNYFTKGNGDGYDGSVLVKYDGNAKYTYTFWISNGTYVFGTSKNGATLGSGVDPNDIDLENNTTVRDVTTTEPKASNDCGGLGSTSGSGVVYCKALVDASGNVTGTECSS